MIKRKITRGLSNEFAEAFKKCDLYELYEKNKDELFIGVRNNYLNLYYNCDSIAKVEYKKTRGSECKKIVCEIDKFYLDGKHYNSDSKAKRQNCEPNQICEKYEKIKEQSNTKKTATVEKKAQSKLVLLNNRNKDSGWLCIDIEYVKEFNSKEERNEANFNGRFDIIALSKQKPHRVALIELKYGNTAIGGKSGIYKHIEDFCKFYDKGFFENHLRAEIIEIIRTQIKLGVSVPFKTPQETDLLMPEFYFIILNNKAETANASTPKQTMAGYLFKDKRWGCKKLSKKYCVEADFGDITKKNNKFHATFLFSETSLDSLDITDIIDGDYDEKIIPQ